MTTRTKFAVALVALVAIIGGMLAVMPLIRGPARDVGKNETGKRAPSAMPLGSVEGRATAAPPVSFASGSASWTPPPSNAPLKDHLDELKQQATNGNPVAACRLAFELDRCYNLKSLQERAARAIANAEESGLFGDMLQRRTEDARRQQQGLYQVQAVCADVPRDESADAWRYSLQAARAGHGPSMARHVVRQGYLPQLATLRVLDGWIAFRDEAPGYLDRAVEMGYREAYVQGLMSYPQGDSSGLAVRKDPALAVALLIALNEVDGNSSESDTRVANFVKRHDIAPVDVQRGRALAPQYAQRLRQRGAQPAGEGAFCEAP